MVSAAVELATCMYSGADDGWCSTSWFPSKWNCAAVFDEASTAGMKTGTDVGAGWRVGAVVGGGDGADPELAGEEDGGGSGAGVCGRVEMTGP